MNAAARIPADSLAVRVLVARHERGLSQRAAAALCGLTFGEWQSIEDGRGARGLDVKVAKIAEGLGYDREWIMWGVQAVFTGGRTPDDLGEIAHPVAA